jgi:P-type E1-E2 ATPase
MVEIAVPGWRRLALEHLVLDLNGTLAVDGRPAPGVDRALEELAGRLELHLVTADTFGTAAGLFGARVAVEVLAPGGEAAQKLAVVQRLGAAEVAALGNGANDAEMLAAAAVGVCVLGPEGAASVALAAADVAAPGPREALELLLNPDRLRATLRR